MADEVRGESTAVPADPARVPLINSPEPTINPSGPPGGGRYLGRLIVELWEPSQTAQSDGLTFTVIGAYPTRTAALAFVKTASSKLSARVSRQT
jgi:hypothetical protein